MACSLSAFTYEILNDAPKACEIAKQAFDAALAHIEELDDDNYKDATIIMQLLKDNLTLWTQNGDGN